MDEPVRQQEGVVLREIGLGEYQEELAALIQGLYRVRQTRFEVPQIPSHNVIDEEAARLVLAGDPSVSNQHEAPLGLLVPVELSVGSRLEGHVDPCYVLRAG